MKVFFKKTGIGFSKLEIYSSLNPIPFTLKLSDEGVLPDTIYARNLSRENFLEFRFNRNSKQLYEITLVALQNDCVKVSDDEYIVSKVHELGNFFECFIEENSELDISLPIQIFRSNSVLRLIWNDGPLVYHSIAKNCAIGINDSGCLSSVVLIDVNQEIISQIIGF